MYFLALAADYDGTLAHDGVVDAATCKALKRCKETRRRLVLVTGRELPDLGRIFPQLKIFDLVVAENGAVIYDPATDQERVIAPAPPAAFLKKLEERNVGPISVGRSIVATWEPHQAAVLEVIRELGLELQIIFNKGAVMILPSGINKATGLAAALADIGLSAHNVVAVGDAENDHAFLSACGCAAAVANALPMVKEAADIKLLGDHGSGVVELIERLDREDARMVPPSRHGILVGFDRAGNEAYLQPYHGSTLIAGATCTGKSTFATALTERMTEKRFEFCVFDPEGDYTDLRYAVPVGNASEPPEAVEAIKFLGNAGTNVVINTQAMRESERRGFFAALLPRVSHLRATTGRPHWLLVDEAHQVVPAGQHSRIFLDDIPTAILITLRPEALATAALRSVETVLAFGRTAPEIITAFARAAKVKVPPEIPAPTDDEILFWACRSGECPCPVTAIRPRQVHIRHAGKYADGDVGPERSFYFRGPDRALNSRAPNLIRFLEIARSVDDATWQHHLRAGDYAAWFRHVIKDEELARETTDIQTDATLDARESRRLIREAVRRRYTIPAEVA